MSYTLLLQCYIITAPYVSKKNLCRKSNTKEREMRSTFSQHNKEVSLCYDARPAN